jgi:hypothetical protein
METSAIIMSLFGIVKGWSNGKCKWKMDRMSVNWVKCETREKREWATIIGMCMCIWKEQLGMLRRVPKYSFQSRIRSNFLYIILMFIRCGIFKFPLIYFSCLSSGIICCTYFNAQCLPKWGLLSWWLRKQWLYLLEWLKGHELSKLDYTTSRLTDCHNWPLIEDDNLGWLDLSRISLPSLFFLTIWR